MSQPEVFIIESLQFDDEEHNRFEGKVLSQILHLSNKKSLYFYIRTKAELKIVLNKFKGSGYRYLHISSHGSCRAMHTTIDDIPFAELQEMLCPVLGSRRLFLSACSMAQRNLAKPLLPKSKCYTIVGRRGTVDFSDATILWASFYHLMFKHEWCMKDKAVEENVQKVASMFHVPMNYYWRGPTKKGFESKIIKP